MTKAVSTRIRLVAVALGALGVLGPHALLAQDTTRTDTTRGRPVHPDSAVRADTARAAAVFLDTVRIPLPSLPDSIRQIPTVHVPPPVPPPWGFGLEIGFTDIAGNTDLQVFNGVFTGEHKRTTEYVLNTRIEARYGKSDGVVAAENSALRLRFDWRPQTKMSPFLAFDLESDMIRKIDERVSGGAGLNFNIAPRQDRHTTFSAGLAFEIENRFASVQPPNVSDFRYTLRFTTLQPVDGTAVFEANAKLQPATNQLSDYLLQGDASLKVTITRKLAFRTRYEWKRDSTPAPGVKPDDRNFTVALLLSW